MKWTNTLIPTKKNEYINYWLRDLKKSPNSKTFDKLESVLYFCVLVLINYS